MAVPWQGASCGCVEICWCWAPAARVSGRPHGFSAQKTQSFTPFAAAAWHINLTYQPHIPTYQPHISTPHINLTYQLHLSTSHINPTYQPHLSTLRINLTYQPHISTSFINLTYQPNLSASLINLTYQPHISTSHINLTYQPHLSTSHINLTYQPHISTSLIKPCTVSRRILLRLPQTHCPFLHRRWSGRKVLEGTSDDGRHVQN